MITSCRRLRQEKVADARWRSCQRLYDSSQAQQMRQTGTLRNIPRHHDRRSQIIFSLRSNTGAQNLRKMWYQIRSLLHLCEDHFIFDLLPLTIHAFLFRWHRIGCREPALLWMHRSSIKRVARAIRITIRPPESGALPSHTLYHTFRRANEISRNPLVSINLQCD
jgi:hypothetical protein